jgi:hypothetical protein
MGTIFLAYLDGALPSEESLPQQRMAPYPKQINNNLGVLYIE